MTFIPKKIESNSVNRIKNMLLMGNIIRKNGESPAEFDMGDRVYVNSVQEMSNIGQERDFRKIDISSIEFREALHELEVEGYIVTTAFCKYSGCCQYATYAYYIEEGEEEETNNMSAQEINTRYEHVKKEEETLRESVRHFLSRHLMDTSEEKPMECSIVIEHEACGLSDLEKTTIDRMYQDGEGIIWVYFFGDPIGMEIDDVPLECLIEIVNHIAQ